MIEHPLAGKVLITTLASWRYFSALSVLAIFIVLILLVARVSSPFVLAVTLLLGLICQYYCWRLWMDCRLFRIFYRYPQQSDIFDRAINTCWGKERTTHQDLASRWAGARRLLYLAGILMLLQWAVLFLSLIVNSF